MLSLGAVFASCDPSVGGGDTTTSGPKAWHVTTLAGDGLAGSADGIGTAASFARPFSIAQSGTTLYVTDRGQHSIRTVDTTTAQVGTIVTNGAGGLAGGYANGDGRTARFNTPSSIVAAGGSTLYVADTNNHRIRRVRPGAAAAAAQVSDFAGSGTAGYADGTGTAAQFDNPTGLAVSGTTLYVADSGNNRIRSIDLANTNKTVSTIAGSGTQGHADGVGTAAQFNGPIGIAVSGGTLYVADLNNHRIRAVDIATKTVRNIAGDGTRESTNGIGTAARFSNPTGIAVSGSTLYVSTRSLIRKLEYRETGS